MSFYFLAFFIYAKNKEVEKMLHLDGRPWALKPYKDYKNQPEKYQEKAVGIRPKFGEFQQFQVHDVNFSQLRRPIYGFVYLQIFVARSRQGIALLSTRFCIFKTKTSLRLLDAQSKKNRLSKVIMNLEIKKKTGLHFRRHLNIYG